MKLQRRQRQHQRWWLPIVVFVVISIQRQGQSFLPTTSGFTTPQITTSTPYLEPLINNRHSSSSSSSTTVLAAGRNTRQDEIRRKIRDLKKDGKLKPKQGSSSTTTGGETAVDQYANKITQKLGKKGGLMKDGTLDDFYAASTNDDDDTTTSATAGSYTNNLNDINNLLDEYEEENEEEDAEMEDLMNQVQKTIAEKARREAAEEMEANRLLYGTDSALPPNMEDVANEMERELEKARMARSSSTITDDDNEREALSSLNKTTSGIGGAWAKNTTATTTTYRPANGGWGYFPRPKDISKAYGGGKKIGAEVSTSSDDRVRAREQELKTKEKLRGYRERVGIDVQSEKDNVVEIEEALAIGQRAMQRGVYDVAVSALEKVTKYCSTNSKLGGKVFLELAMAYEAVGRSTEAIRVYTALSYSRIEKIKMDSKRLLIGIEAMQFMRDEVKADSFQRKKSQQTFIDTTGLGNIAENFDDVYQTAYIDLNRGGNYYRKLTENVVRSVREARQILLRATASGEVERQKIVQALRSYNRGFEDALREELEQNKRKEEPIALMNGLPIAMVEEKRKSATGAGMDAFNLGTPEDMKENLLGEWKLQLMTDKKGDSVSFFDDKVSWQNIRLEDDNDSSIMTYQLVIPAAFFKLAQRGQLNFDGKQRVISRYNVECDDGTSSFLTDLVGKSSASKATNAEQQIISVDSELLISRLAVLPKNSQNGNAKDYFSVWRRVEPGSYSSSDTKQ